MIGSPRKRKKQDCSIYVYEKVQNENHIMQSNESVFENDHCHDETDKIVVCTARDCACSVRFIFHNF